jgi:hypothetical protein
MLSRLPPVRRSAPLAVAVFLIGAGIGGVIIALSYHAAPKRVVVKQIVTTTSAGATSPPATTTHVAARPVQRRVPSSASVVPAGAEASFVALQAQLGGQVGLAVAPLGAGPIQTLGDFQTGHAWSTMKVPVLATLLYDDERQQQVLSAQGHSDAALALEQSDNAAAESLFSAVEQAHGGLDGASTAVQQMLSNAGDQTTAINTTPNNQGFTTWGQSQWSTTGEILFYRALARGCLLGPHDTAYVLKLMRNVTDSQRWGAGAAGYPTTIPLAFKAGWGPESTGGYLVRQTAIVGSGSHGYVVSMIALPSDGSFSGGVSIITSLATWAREHLALNADGTPVGCAAQP